MKSCKTYLLAISLFLCACQGKHKRIYIDTNYSVENLESEDMQTNMNGNNGEIVVPFTEVGGVKSIAVKVNGIGVNMLFDTGCSSTLISIAEANYLYQKGLLENEDILGNVQAIIADGSVVNNALINLKELIIADKIICRNVRATVTENASAPLLLGNEVLDRAASYTIDNTRKIIIFKLKEE